MANIWIICLALGLTAAVWPSTAEALPKFDESDVFVGGMDDVNTYRIPSMVCTAKGTVLVFCEARRGSSVDGSPTHLALKRSIGNTGVWMPPSRKGRVPDGRSRKRNMTWLGMQIMRHTDGKDAYMNPVPVIDRADGAILLLVNRYGKYENDESKSQILVFRSTDEGATWSEPIDIAPSIGRKALGPGVGIQTESGKLVVPTYDGVIYSDDHGKTWQSGGRTTGPISETQVVELADGSLMLNTRSQPNRTVCISTDGGKTWGRPRVDKTLTDSELYGGCQASLLRYTTAGDVYAKSRLLFANPADRRHRFNMTVRISYDEGKTWPVSKLVREGTGAYSCLTVLPDKTIGLIYETGPIRGKLVSYYGKLTFARFNLDWLSDGADTLADMSAGRASPKP